MFDGKLILPSFFRTINMQYPSQAGNANYDGKVHMVQPLILEELENGMYRLSYNDLSLHKFGMITLLGIENGKFIKVPLKNYSNINKVKAIRKIPTSELPNQIGVSEAFHDLEEFNQHRQSFSAQAVATSPGPGGGPVAVGAGLPPHDDNPDNDLNNDNNKTYSYAATSSLYELYTPAINGMYELVNPKIAKKIFWKDDKWVTEEEIELAKEDGYYPKFVARVKAASASLYELYDQPVNGLYELVDPSVSEKIFGSKKRFVSSSEIDAAKKRGYYPKYVEREKNYYSSNNGGNGPHNNVSSGNDRNPEKVQYSFNKKYKVYEPAQHGRYELVDPNISEEVFGKELTWVTPIHIADAESRGYFAEYITRKQTNELNDDLERASFEINGIEYTICFDFTDYNEKEVEYAKYLSNKEGYSLVKKKSAEWEKWAYKLALTYIKQIIGNGYDVNSIDYDLASDLIMVQYDLFESQFKNMAPDFNKQVATAIRIKESVEKYLNLTKSNQLK